MARRLQLIVLAHLWALAPLVILWFAVPSWRGQPPPTAETVRTLGYLAIVAVGYVAIRTWSTLRFWRPHLDQLWAYVDVLLITTALAVLRDPIEGLALLYFLPIASAVASGSARHLLSLTAAATTGFLFIILESGMPWSVSLVYRLIFIGVMASVYGWVIRTVAVYERAAERAEYQKELSREIHDGIQYLLATMGARLELARRLIGEDPARTARIIEEQRETLRGAGDELRYLVRRLRTESHQMDLTTALRQQVAALADRWMFDVEVEIPARLPRLAPPAEHAVLRLIQESLTNAARHAQASRVEVRLAVAAGTLRCTIADNGIGLDPQAALAAGGGLRHLQERVASAGGVLAVDAPPGQGTVVTAEFRIP